MPGSFPPWLPGIAPFPGTSQGGADMIEPNQDPVAPLRCSARGCTMNAEFALLWNNPKIHPPERRKTWLACAEHRTTLTEFLSVRGMFRECEVVGPNFAEPTRDEPTAP